MWPFVRLTGKVQGDAPPPGVEDFISYTAEPGALNTDVARWAEGDVPDLGDDYFPTIANQAAILTHWDYPPANENPQRWYDDRNVWAKQQRTEIETQDALPIDAVGPMADQPAADPRWNPPTVQRPTAHQSPSSYRFYRPFDQTSEHELNGVHMSLADNRRAYELTGSAGLAPKWNNSYRIDPPNNDATAVFVGDTVANDREALVWGGVTQDVFSSPYRL